MNILPQLSQIPKRESKPRFNGLTMVMDKGLSLKDAESLIDSAEQYIDFVKLGFGTPHVYGKLREKIELYKENNIKVFFGGTYFEAFIIRNQLEDYLNLLNYYQLDTLEVSDGSIEISHQEKMSYIHRLSKNFTVLSEVGYKNSQKEISNSEWSNLMSLEIEAGSSYVITESRESGTSGIYDNSGEAKSQLVNEILSKVSSNKIIFEAPQEKQQAYFIHLVGSNANLGNIHPSSVIALEATRLGLRGDTFHLFLDKKNS